MGELVNLRRARKQRARAAAECQAAIRRVSHGQSKVEAARTDAEQSLVERRLSAHYIVDRDRTEP